jgi:hypothetical protein
MPLLEWLQCNAWLSRPLLRANYHVLVLPLGAVTLEAPGRDGAHPICAIEILLPPPRETLFRTYLPCTTGA